MKLLDFIFGKKKEKVLKLDKDKWFNIDGLNVGCEVRITVSKEKNIIYFNPEGGSQCFSRWQNENYSKYFQEKKHTGTVVKIEGNNIFVEVRPMING
jgi:hypothetical protein